VGRAGSYVASQSLSAPYYQPLVPVQKVDYKNWTALRDLRRKSQLCTLEQSATVTEKKGGFDLRIQARGASGGVALGVPLAIEINLREGGRLEGCRPAPHVEDGWILESGEAKYTVGGQSLRIGPGAAPHLLTQLRGAEAKLPGVSVYLTGYTPFDRTISLEFSSQA
jgi:mannose-6-phosphate isomerase-like protein (cupin superfamily)